MKINKKIIQNYVVLAIVAFGLPISAMSSILVSNNIDETYSSTIKISKASNYTIAQSIKCEVVLDFIFSQTDTNPHNFSCKVPRFDTRGPGSSLSANTPPYQVSERLEHDINGSQYEPFLTRDRFNNTFDVFNYTFMPYGQKMSYHTKYNITLNQVIFDDLEDYYPTYNYFDPIFDLYCNNSELYTNISDPQLINCAINEMGIHADDSPMTKARKTCAFVSNHLEFQSMSGVHRGASWAYENGIGDGSEFCDLMVTLLRILKIPARKVEGFIIGPNNLEFKPYEGYTQTNNFNTGIWIEYYIPNIGWIACEPQVATEYKTSHFTLIHSVVGAWFSFPLIDNSTFWLSEWNNAMYTKTSPYDATINFTVKIIDINLVSSNKNNIKEFDWIKTISIVFFCSIAVLCLVVFIGKRKFE